MNENKDAESAHPPESETEYVHAIAVKGREIAEEYGETAVEAGRNPGGSYDGSIEEWKEDLDTAASFMFPYEDGMAPQTGVIAIESAEAAEMLGRVVYWSFAGFADTIEGGPYKGLKAAAKEAIRNDLKQASKAEWGRMKEKDGQKVWR